jgi:hypothetical protein
LIEEEEEEKGGGRRGWRRKGKWIYLALSESQERKS